MWIAPRARADLRAWKMKTYLNKESQESFMPWLIHKMKRIPEVYFYYRSDNRQDFDALFEDSYPLTLHYAFKLPDGKYLPDIKAIFILEQVGERLKVGIKYHPQLEKALLSVLKELVDDFPETAKDINPQIARIEAKADDGQMERAAVVIPLSPDIFNTRSAKRWAAFPRIPAHWQDVVKRIEQIDAAQGLGLARYADIRGPGKEDGTAMWEVGNTYIFVSSDYGESEAVSVLHWKLINEDEQPNKRALKTWRKLVGALTAQQATGPEAGTHEQKRAALETARRSLAILEQRAAGYTSLTMPAHLQIELEDKRKEVEKLESRSG